MNKVFCKKGFLFSFILTGCLIFFNTSCGLDTFYELPGPKNTIHTPDCSSIDYSENYFEFFTLEKEENDYLDNGIKFQGTEVYYKIYGSSSRLQSEADDLITTANREDSNSSAAEKLIQSYHFQPLRGLDHYDVNVLVPSKWDNQRITIRLSDYSGLYLSQITADGKPIYGNENSPRVIPVRNLPDKTSFNFRNSDPDTIPVSDDVDVNTSGSSSSVWYVSMFAVAIGQDASYSPIYSNILYLGSVAIPVE